MSNKTNHNTTSFESNEAIDKDEWKISDYGNAHEKSNDCDRNNKMGLNTQYEEKEQLKSNRSSMTTYQKLITAGKLEDT